MKYDIEKRKLCFKKWIEKKRIVEVQPCYRARYQTNSAPTDKTIMRWVKLFEKNVSVHVAARESKIKNQKRVEARIMVEKLVSANPEFSIRRLSTLTQLSYSLTRNILQVDLKLKPYKYQECQKLLEADYQKRVDLATWLLSLAPSVFQYIICTDESYFYLVESVNKQNNRMWLKERPTD